MRVCDELISTNQHTFLTFHECKCNVFLLRMYHVYTCMCIYKHYISSSYVNNGQTHLPSAVYQARAGLRL